MTPRQQLLNHAHGLIANLVRRPEILKCHESSFKTIPKHSGPGRTILPLKPAYQGHMSCFGFHEIPAPLRPLWKIRMHTSQLLHWLASKVPGVCHAQRKELGRSRKQKDGLFRFAMMSLGWKFGRKVDQPVPIPAALEGFDNGPKTLQYKKSLRRRSQGQAGAQECTSKS